MKIVTWNINGYRSAEKTNSMQELIKNNNPDIICLQEIKMNNEVTDNFGYNCYYNFAEKRGYSGTMILCKEEPLSVRYEIGLERFDQEGRFILLEFNDFVLMNIYVPHGGRQKENHPYKFATINRILELIKGIEKRIIVCTDFNIAHTEKDVKNYKTNYKNNMFTPEERAKIDEILSLGLVDSFRCVNQSDDVYSWWSNAFNARERNMGWRIDYIFISDVMKDKIKRVRYLKEQLGSDHCPCMIELLDKR